MELEASISRETLRLLKHPDVQRRHYQKSGCAICEQNTTWIAWRKRAATVVLCRQQAGWLSRMTSESAVKLNEARKKSRWVGQTGNLSWRFRAFALLSVGAATLRDALLEWLRPMVGLWKWRKTKLDRGSQQRDQAACSPVLQSLLRPKSS
jgi:hypothetical protein